MSDRIFLVQDGGGLVEMREEAYITEDRLQTLLGQYPDLLVGNHSDEPQSQRWLLVSREMPLASDHDGASRWSVDHLFLDRDAIPTLVEVKRSSDTRIRREVVGQMLDYAANGVVYWPVAQIRARFEATCERDGRDSERVLSDLLGPDSDANRFWETVGTNLLAGKIRMVFVADEIPQELRRIVEFLNGQMKPAEVLAVEIKQFVGQGVTTLVPRAIGQTAESQRAKSQTTGAPRKWDETSFFEDLVAQRGAEEASVARRIFEWAPSHFPRSQWGKGKKYGSLYPTLDHKGQSFWPIALWTYGQVDITFADLKQKYPFEDEGVRMELLRRLNHIPGVNLPPDSISRYPNTNLATLKDPDALQQFLAALEWVEHQIKAS